MKVLKFGGASLKDKAAYTETMRVLKEEKEPKVLVLSAIYGMTDWLENAIREARQNEQSIEATTTKIRAWHANLLKDLVSDPTQIADCMSILEERIQKLERLLYGVAYTEEITPQIYALVMSFGERLSVILSAAIFNANGIRRSTWNLTRSGLKPTILSRMPPLIWQLFARTTGTSQSFTEKRYHAARYRFFGVNKDGKVTLFGATVPITVRRSSRMV
jgi:aspartokinase